MRSACATIPKNAQPASEAKKKRGRANEVYSLDGCRPTSKLGGYLYLRDS